MLLLGGQGWPLVHSNHFQEWPQTKSHEAKIPTVKWLSRWHASISFWVIRCQICDCGEVRKVLLNLWCPQCNCRPARSYRLGNAPERMPWLFRDSSRRNERRRAMAFDEWTQRLPSLAVKMNSETAKGGRPRERRVNAELFRGHCFGLVSAACGVSEGYF